MTFSILTIFFDYLLKLYFHHFYFRLNQGLRIFNFNPRQSVAAVLLLAGLMMFKIPDDLYPLLCLSIVILFHFRRKDILFLKKVFGSAWRWIIGLENVLLYLVLLMLNIHYQLDSGALLTSVPLLLLSFWHPKPKSYALWHWRFIPNSLFEWRTVLRQNPIGFFVIYLLLLSSAYHVSSLVLGGLLIRDFLGVIFIKNENKEILIAYFKRISLRQKIRYNALFFNVLLLPVAIIFLIFNFYRSEYILWYFTFANLYFLLFLTRKYSEYHSKKSENHFDVSVSLVYFIYTITIIPAIWRIFNNYKQGQKNITNYVGNS
ncbi:hypothetical protein [Riemerella columbina]|uniref:hypothetical protein n=1 Tax=Riemerella columbina TaxID=103810 RepID=UPI002670B941|nr:hypothetical protein [Riemerella columbina]WKS95020.1 hypothetical protein NYR17_08845 [Riemerella columbina]